MGIKFFIAIAQMLLPFVLGVAENTTPEALNSLLKFLEEPQGSDTLAILIVENQARILPTIVSRCQTLTRKHPAKKRA